MESRKVALMNLRAWQQWRRRHGERTYGNSRGIRGWDKLREKHGTYTLPSVK